MIILLCQEFPFGVSESFLENEIHFFGRIPEKMLIVSCSDRGIARELPSNVSVKIYKNQIKFYDRIRPFLSRNFYKHTIFMTTSLPKILSQYRIYRESLKRADYIKSLGYPLDQKYYSFWTDEWVVALSILKIERRVNTFFSRGHGYDIISDRWKFGFIPFRSFVLQNISYIFPASNFSFNYLVSNHPDFRLKFKEYRLGVFDNGLSPTPNGISKEITIVSCSSAIKLKRLDLIFDIISRVNFKVRWVHFGNGIELDTMINRCIIFHNITFIPMGSRSNKEVLDFYRNNPVNCFIHMSDTEGGVPVAIQEAVSFGIPIFARDSGGVSEIVNSRTGVLISHDFMLEDAVKALECLIDMSADIDFRRKIRDVWRNEFNATLNYSSFYDFVLKIP